MVIASWLAGLLGFGLLLTGIAQWSVPATYLVAGLGLMAWAWLADRAVAKLPKGG
ncbi:hypothetical protein [Pseudomonas tohonis]|uniref:hypothetical protein n=1 Tax=Pseudomonas tohonis TaxID=2725477 RepID=UPI001F2C79E5|nr:hypothetical protein [Pseudomonas tohonis]